MKKDNDESSMSAEVILKSKTGKKMSEGNTPITSRNISEFEPPNESIKMVMKAFKELGFEVSQNGLTVTITGSQRLFEKVFKIELFRKQDNKSSISVKPDKELVIPSGLSNVIEQIVFPPGPTYFK